MNLKDNVKILSVLPLVGHPRDSKRISMLKEGGFDISAIAFDRKYHKGRLPDCDVQFMGEIEHGNYLSRIVKMIKAIPMLRLKIKQSDIVYASGADMAYISLIAGIGLKKQVVVEIGDIREIQVATSLVGKIYRIIDKWLIDKCTLLVSTTPSFVSEYYRKWIKAKIPAIIIENKLERSIYNYYKPEEIAKGDESGNVFRIGYFGLLRDEWSLKVLIALAEARPKDIQIVLAGIPFNEESVSLLNKAKELDNIKYFGEYKSPDDLNTIYGSVDMVWSCYPFIKESDWNLKWARPNRFYESCCFKKPTFTRDGCQDAVDVVRYDIGKIIREYKIDKVINEINSIVPEDVIRWKTNMQSLPEKVYLYTDEDENLKEAILKIKTI